MLELNPEHIDATLLLAEMLHHNKQYGDSLAIYARVKSVNAARAPRLFIGKAHTHLRLEDFKGARSAAQEALKYSKEPRDKEAARSILSWLDQRDAYQKRGYVVAAPLIEGDVDPPPVGSAEDVLPSVRGILTEVECLDKRARLIMQAGQRQIAFLIADPDAIRIRNSPGANVELTCGRQPPATRVLIEFVEKADNATKTLGEVRSLEFLR
jgi:hypothetical protein